MRLQPYIDNFDTFFLDCDGVLWEGEKLIPFAKDVILLLKENNKGTFFISNNSTKTVNDYLKKFENYGISVDENEIMISSLATLKYLENQSDILNVYVVGEDGLVDSIRLGGYNVYHDDVENNLIKEIDVVIVGMDRTVNNRVLTIAIRAIINGARFIGTNPDPTYPSEDGISPGAGTMISAISGALNIFPEIICGKPDPLMANLLLNDPSLNLNPKNILMIGDRVSTDLQFAKNAGIEGLLVKTGFGKIEFEQFPSFPYFKVLNSISELLIF
ncbi:MAG: putative hydrolase YutF [Candidatus Heimdallarchaeota archaeon LC_3]|nr:MAG: putative hydrolase YutF [Candidatus Heimdallarchaeota archaeon LC_3]